MDDLPPSVDRLDTRRPTTQNPAYRLSAYIGNRFSSQQQMPPRAESSGDVVAPLSALEFHLLLVLGRGALYGYAIMKAIEEESGGRISPEIGSLYRVISRLMARGLLEETDQPEGEETSHPGRERKYYRLTADGRAVARAEAARLREVLDIARVRNLLPRGEAG